MTSVSVRQDCTWAIPQVPGVTHRFVTARGTRFHVAQVGAGDPVVLLHGLAQHWYAWRKLIPELAGQYQLFLDPRGCGWSEATRRGYGTREQARDVLAVMDVLGLERVRLIGHDSGGWLGFGLCLLAPERFGGFVALNTMHPWPGRATLVRNAWRFWYTALWEYPGRRLGAAAQAGFHQVPAPALGGRRTGGIRRNWTSSSGPAGQDRGRGRSSGRCGSLCCAISRRW